MGRSQPSRSGSRDKVGVLPLVPIALSSPGVNLLVGTENGLMLLDRSGQGKVYNLINRRRFQQMDVLEGLNVLVTISGMSLLPSPHWLSVLPWSSVPSGSSLRQNLPTSVRGKLLGELAVLYSRVKVLDLQEYLQEQFAPFTCNAPLSFSREGKVQEYSR